MGQRDRQADGRTPDRYITLTARRGQRNKLENSKFDQIVADFSLEAKSERSAAAECD